MAFGGRHRLDSPFEGGARAPARAGDVYHDAGGFEAETGSCARTSPCDRLHLRLPAAVPLRRGNGVILVASFINSPVTSQS